MITSGGTTTLGLYDNASEIRKKADITYVDSRVGDFQAQVVSLAGGHLGYATLALATTASTGLPANTVVEVTNDPTTSNNGLYLWNGTTLTKSAYDPLTQAKSHTDIEVGELKQNVLVAQKNLYNKDTKKVGYFINPLGGIAFTEGWSCSDYMPVLPSSQYAISATSRRVGSAFFDANKAYISNSYEQEFGTVVRTAPTNAAYLVINIDSPEITGVNVQVELGASATVYAEYMEVLQPSIIPDSIPKNEALLVKKDELSGLIKPMTIKNYDEIVLSKNLFNIAAIQDGKFIGVTGRISSAAGWGMSDLIPVTEGQVITLSGSRGRVGAAFFDSETNIYSISGSYTESATMPLTLTAPVGATFFAFNVYYPTNPNYSNIQVELGSVATYYVPYSETQMVNPNFIAQDYSRSLMISGNFATVKSLVDGKTIELNLRLTKENTHSQSTVFNFVSDIIDGVLQRTTGDDVAPFRMDGTTIGANHGYQKSDLTLIDHGKTVADIGSVWTNGGKEYVIVDVSSTSILSITSRSDNSAFVSGQLIHVSGASNTTSFTPTSTTSSQWYPVFKNRKLTVFVDDVLIDQSLVKTYPFKNEVAFHESYEIMRKTDIIEWLITNKGQNPVNYDAIPCSMANFSYVFDRECGCTIYASLTAYKAVPFVDMMGTQSMKLSGTPSYYVPKTVAFTQDSVNYNFTQLTPMISLPNPIYFTAARNEIGANPVDRLIQFNASNGYATGYLPILDAAPSVRPSNAPNKYLEIRDGSLKVYPRLIDGLKAALVEGDSFACIAYRKYFVRQQNRTSNYVVRSKMGDYLYLDWHTTLTDTVYLPDDLIGREFEVHEKSSNVTLLSKFSTNTITVKVDSSKSYGYLVLKFK